MSDVNEEFWKQVIPEPGDPADAKVGDAIYIEGQKDGKVVERMVRIVTKHWTEDDGLSRIAFRKPYPGEAYEAPTLTILTSNSMADARYEP